MAEKEGHSERVQQLMNNPKNIRNIGIVSHIHHGKTTLTDNLAAQSGMMSAELVGERMLTWIDTQERERLMTIYGATVTMAHRFDDQQYLINLLDTPGHVDFGGDVTRAMRAVDGAVVMVCAVEGIMPQTETVLKQALAERVKPILFINKVDRAIKELQLTPEALLQRLEKLVIEVNKFVRNHVEPEFADKWAFSVKDGSVAFGSALRKWAISVPYMKKSGVTFKEIIEACASGRDEELATKAPMYTVVLDMVIQHLPSPIEAQPYRVLRVWKGDPESGVGKQMITCDQNGKLGAVITKVVQDPHAGLISTVRIFSGRIVAGQNVYALGLKKPIKVQQVTTFIADKRQPVEYATAGNVVGLVGIAEASVGETLCDADAVIEAFEEIKHIFEPVVTKALEPKRPQDLPKLVEILRILGKEDTTLKIEINQETGETLVSGLGELHLDAKVERKIREKGIELLASTPIVVYRETCTKKAGPVEGKSPNKHNAFYVQVEPVPAAVYKAMIDGALPSSKEMKKKDQAFIDKLRELGMDKKDTDGLELLYERNFLIDATKGIQYLNEAMELIKQSFKEVANEGPLGREPVTGMIIRVADAKLHEDAIHRGPAQVIPAVRQAIKNAVLMGGATLLEPRQIVLINSDHESVGNVMKEVQTRRGEVLDVTTELGSTNVKAKLPVAEMFGFEAALKSATGGRGFYSLVDVTFENIPRELLERTVVQIRTRKGLSAEMPRPELG
ncbi:MAG: elongation factor EF-2 [Candidatus Aenigmatarchaeota archaeon]|nr:MAG: elongation factor EF-2 [Candidatus Aenigmarchaeota archaeon]